MRSWYGNGPRIDFERQTVELHVKLLTICVLGDLRSLFSKTFYFLSLPAKRVRTFIQFVYVSQVPRCWTGRGHVRFVFQIGPGLYLGDVAPQMKSWDCGSWSRGGFPGNGFPGKFPGKLAGGTPNPLINVPAPNKAYRPLIRRTGNAPRPLIVRTGAPGPQSKTYRPLIKRTGP